MTGDRPRRYQVLLALSRLTLVVENIWPRLWPLFALVGAFVALALFDVLPALPGWLHFLVLMAYAAFAAFVVYRSFRGLARITRASARHKLERDSGLSNRPLTALEDTLAAGSTDAESVALWQAHLKQMATNTDRLQLAAPAPRVAARDPYGLRILVVLVFVIAIAAGDDAGARLERAVTPHVMGGPDGPIAVEIWITPPVYTRAAPMFLEVGEPGSTENETATGVPGEPLQIPHGSTVLAQVTGSRSAPVMDLGERTLTFDILADETGASSFRVETELDTATRIRVEVGGDAIAEWTVDMVADRVPEIAFVDRPAPRDSPFLALHYEATDDYGLIDVSAVIGHAKGSPDLAGNTEIKVPLTLPTLDAGRVEGGGSHDLTEHVWAGQTVTVQLTAEDATGQIGRSDVRTMVLPERTFTHPVAIVLIEQRKRLLADMDAVRLEVARSLSKVAEAPELFASDIVISLGLGVAHSRLIHQRSEEAIPSVRRLLWDLALRLEQGTVPVAEQALKEANERLAEALRSDRSAEEIEQLMDEVQQALREYLKAVAAELARRGETLQPPSDQAEQFRSQDLMDMVETARRLAQVGARDSAQRLLSQLQKMLEAMRQGLQNSDTSRELMEAQQLMNDLRSLAGRQQDLLDRTFRDLQELRAREQERRDGGRATPQQREGEPRSADAPQSGEAAGEQEALRQQLGDLMKRFDEMLGGIPQPLGNAERAMKGAGTALDGGRPGDAVPLQNEALRQLQRADQQAAEMMSQQLGGLAGMLAGDGEQPGENGQDPFGRSGDMGQRGFGVDEVGIPDAMKLRRVEQILQELRRRASEPSRSRSELDYIDRLLRRF